MISKKPDFGFEKQAWRRGYKTVIGVDEVGRGALAGPVVAGAVSLKRTVLFKNGSFLDEIDDSKRLSAKKREELAKIIKQNAAWGIGEASVSFINKHGIVKATAKAMRSAVAQVAGDRQFVLVDAFHIKYIPGVGLANQRAIIKGDQKSLSIAAASIIAKVHRDRLMKKRSVYGWRQNKGYGTAKHIAAIKKHGPSRFHRLAFVKNFI
ncbi:MAG: ribonuclease HII [Patescibacteria group bacterium]|nr:ribonuclease HII [Patescibacteria group bacterium]MCL5432272.1 ribonuclease HII [Patescibacteria group bacterium]